MANYNDNSTQQNTAQGYGAFYFGATAATLNARAVHSNVDRSFKCRFDDGSEVIVAFLAGGLYPYRIRHIMTASGTSISSASRLVVGII